VTDLLPQHEMVGFAQVHLPAVAGDAKLRWYVVVTAGREAALAPIHRLLWMTGGIGAAAVLLCFFLGLVLARRQIIRPLLTLADGAHRIEQGDLDYRLPQPAQSGSVFGRDEIGRLACDFNRMADEVGRHLRAAQESDRLKAQFLDVASHELRTPITYIQGATELALRQGLSDSALVGRIAARAQHLARIVANMFKLLGSGTYESALCLGDVDLPSLIAGLRQDMAPFATQRGQTLQLRIAPDLPVLRADADKVRDILANLIDNAIRFSPDGATIRLDAQAVDSSVELAVTDAGQGLSQAQREHLFGPFAMPPADVPHHSSANGEHLWRGVDLALSVVKRFVELHEGTIATEDAQPGTRFVVRLPIRAPAAEP
jgi:signal transduction histidine kinase